MNGFMVLWMSFTASQSKEVHIVGKPVPGAVKLEFTCTSALQTGLEGSSPLVETVSMYFKSELAGKSTLLHYHTNEMQKC